MGEAGRCIESSAVLVIGGIYNGMYLQGYSFVAQYVVTGLVLLAAGTIDSLSRRGSASGSVTRI